MARNLGEVLKSIAVAGDGIPARARGERFDSGRRPGTNVRELADLESSAMKTTLRLTTLFFLLATACLALLPTTYAVNPPPDGGYANGNTAEGTDALLNLSTGANNTAVGNIALQNNTVGDYNTATGANALSLNFNGSGNTAHGYNALGANTTGLANTAMGKDALGSNTFGSVNTASGDVALYSNTSGSGNTATGVNALFGNTTASNNTADGLAALMNNTTGANNTASGAFALNGNTTGSNNLAAGYQALHGNSTGDNNMASGTNALYSNTIGINNLAMGTSALYKNTYGKSNTALGNNALLNNVTGNNNIALGASAGINLTTGGNNICIGALGATGESNTIRIGRAGFQTNAYITGVSGATVPGGVAVMIDSAGHLGTLTSSARYKEAIQPMDQASEAILALQPVTFHYKKELDPESIPQFGLVAEQVAKVNPDLVARDEQGKPYTVRYEAVNAMLLNEFLKEHRKIEALEETVTQLKSALKEQAAQIQKVSERLPASE